jgi:hypothetical protein
MYPLMDFKIVVFFSTHVVFNEEYVLLLGLDYNKFFIFLSLKTEILFTLIYYIVYQGSTKYHKKQRKTFRQQSKHDMEYVQIFKTKYSKWNEYMQMKKPS